MKIFRKFSFFFQNIISSIFIAFLIAVILRIFFFSFFYIPSTSMENTIKQGESVLVWKFLYNKKIPVMNVKFPFGFKIKRGDIIAFYSPQNSFEIYIKRCIGLQGDKIVFYENKIILNDKYLEEPYLKDKNVILYDKSYYKVPEGKIFVLGDNRMNSSDSRDFGFIPEKNIVGKVIMVIYPFKRIRILK